MEIVSKAVLVLACIMCVFFLASITSPNKRPRTVQVKIPRARQQQTITEQENISEEDNREKIITTPQRKEPSASNDLDELHLAAIFSEEAVPMAANLAKNAEFVFGAKTFLHLISTDKDCSNIPTSARVFCELTEEDFSSREPHKNGEIIYGKKAYLEVVRRKNVIFKSFLQKHNAAVFVDVDVVFLQDPYGKIGTDKHSLLQFSYNYDQKPGCNKDGQPFNNDANTGLWFARNTAEVLDFFDMATRLIAKGYDKTDQGGVWAALRESDISSKVSMLNCEMYQSGLYFFNKRCLDCDVVAVHANFIISSKVKVGCFKAAGLWFNESKGNKQFVLNKEFRVAKDKLLIKQCT
eukprot:m.242339 g.242339  ORF g.242339 m.242339 type:complete len:351 (+) comp16092_c0_seq4:434-1486(+)